MESFFVLTQKIRCVVCFSLFALSWGGGGAFSQEVAEIPTDRIFFADEIEWIKELRSVLSEHAPDSSQICAVLIARKKSEMYLLARIFSRSDDVFVAPRVVGYSMQRIDFSNLKKVRRESVRIELTEANRIGELCEEVTGEPRYGIYHPNLDEENYILLCRPFRKGHFVGWFRSLEILRRDNQSPCQRLIRLFEVIETVAEE